MTRVYLTTIFAAVFFTTVGSPNGALGSSITILAPSLSPADLRALSEALSVDDTHEIDLVDTLRESIDAESDLLVLYLDRNRSRKLSSQAISKLRQRRVIGIGYGSAEIFGSLGLEINGGACAHDDHNPNPELQVEENSLLPDQDKERFVAFRIPGEQLFLDKQNLDTLDYNFAMHIPSKSDATTFVDVIGRWPDDENYAPIVKQNTHILVGLAAPPSFWTQEYRTFLALLATSLAKEKVVPFERAKWDISEPGEYEFELAEGRSTKELSSRHFYFQFTESTSFSASLDHTGSSSIMMLFNGENRSHWTRKDGKSGEALQIDVEVSARDIQGVADGYWYLKVTNFDRANRATCKLKIGY